MQKFFVVALLSTFVLLFSNWKAKSANVVFSPFDADSTYYAEQLGRHLFYDPVLSRDSNLSCASCHHQHLAFTDGQPTSIGFRGMRVTRNAPTLTNVKDLKSLLWDGVNPSLEAQVLVPIQEHSEFDFHPLLIAERLKKNSFYVDLSKKAFGRVPDPFVITRSIAAFERTLISNNSKFDSVRRGEVAFDEEEALGKYIFFEKLYCAHCHNGANFTNQELTNNGLYLEYADSGRMRLTELEKDRAIFKVPTLRNIALTAPYMHDGSISSLDKVIDHYASGGKLHFNKSAIIVPFKISNSEKKALIKFLNTLTDTRFTTDTSFQKPISFAGSQKY